MKSTQTSANFVTSTSEMRYQGIILNLKEFYGDILIKDNEFKSIQFKYES